MFTHLLTRAAYLTIPYLISLPSMASTAVLDFDFAHGTIINNQYNGQGINISASGGQNIGIVYDSELGGSNGGSIDGADNDLERLGLGTADAGGWDGGNLGRDYQAGGLLIVQENGPRSSAPTYGSGANQITSASNYDPDDNVGGIITFEIDEDNFIYNYFNVTLADFEEDGNNYSTRLTGALGTVEIFSFSDFTDPTHANYDPSITSGDNHINHLPEIYLSTGEALSKVDIIFNSSSGSVSNIIFSESSVAVPEPSSLSLLALGAMTLLHRRQR